jgi:hypothetical protein
MSRDRITARATVTVTLEIVIDSTWGDDCTVSQIHKQAIDSWAGIKDLREAISHDRVHIIGTPIVDMVTASTK